MHPLRFARFSSVALATATFHAPAVAQSTWTDWTSTTPLSAAPEVVVGDLDGVTVTYVGQLNPGAVIVSTSSYWNNHPTTYTSPLVTTPPLLGDLLRFTGGAGTGEHVITFSAPIDDPVLAVLSLGSYGIGAQMDFDAPFVIENVGPGAFGNGTLTMLPGNVLEGREGNGLIRFPGTFTELRFTTPVAESWSGLTVGMAGSIGVRSCGGAVPNSTGEVALIVATGSTIVAEDSLRLAAGRLPANTFGYFLCSRNAGYVPHAGGGQGTLCLGGNIGRFNTSVSNSGAWGSFAIAVDLDQMPSPTGPVAAAAGETWHFQCWFRDAIGGVATSNFTHSVIVDLQ